MNLTFFLKVFAITVILAITLGCSGGFSTSPDISSKGQDSTPLYDSADSMVLPDNLGIMGAFHLSIDSSNMSAELVPLRNTSIGESYIVSGIGFFTAAPCADCLTLSGFKLVGDTIALMFKIKHPFDRGDPTQPPTAKNRLDLDVFDLAMVIVPTSASLVNFPLTNVNVYSNIVANAAGYTRELANLINNQAAMPYVLVVDNTQSLPPHTWNKFAMGAESFFDVFFNITPGVFLQFDTYLTMGYGASAKKPQRLDPKYYNPEFNRKAAWKVTVIPPGPWLDTNAVPTTVTVKVYDWQIGATVYGNPTDFANAPPDNVYAASEVENVSIEILGMTDAPVAISTPTAGAGTPSDPLIYEITVPNENLLPTGIHPGIVKVTDERAPLTPAEGRDYLIDSPDGIELLNYTIPEYAAYQTFEAEVIHDGITLEQNNYKIYNSPEQIIDNSETGSVRIGFVGSNSPSYFNLAVNGVWVIQNVPLLSDGGAGVAQSMIMNFDLLNPPGINVTEIQAGWLIEDMPSPGIPPPMGLFSVGDRDVIMGRGFVNDISYLPPVLLLGAVVTEVRIIKNFSNWLALDCGLSECAPAAVSTSLKYLQQTSGKPAADKPTDIATMKNATGWTCTGCNYDFPKKKDDYMNANGYGVNTNTHPAGTPPKNLNSNNRVSSADLDAVMQALSQGSDVEIVGGGHCAVVVGMAKLADGRYTITVKHDTKQGQWRGVETETIIYDPNAPNAVANGGAFFNGHNICGFIAESPAP